MAAAVTVGFDTVKHWCVTSIAKKKNSGLAASG